MSARAEISADRQSVTLSVGAWSMVIARADLPAQVRFYRVLWSRGSKQKNTPGPNARHFEGTLAALETAVRELQHD